MTNTCCDPQENTREESSNPEAAHIISGHVPEGRPLGQVTRLHLKTKINIALKHFSMWSFIRAQNNSVPFGGGFLNLAAAV